MLGHVWSYMVMPMHCLVWYGSSMVIQMIARKWIVLKLKSPTSKCWTYKLSELWVVVIMLVVEVKPANSLILSSLATLISISISMLSPLMKASSASSQHLNSCKIHRHTNKQTNWHLALYDFVWLCMSMYDYVWLCIKIFQTILTFSYDSKCS